ncbi:MAG: hypothetical protein ACLFRX_01480 [Gemmatimonadota bacterium]
MYASRKLRAGLLAVLVGLFVVACGDDEDVTGPDLEFEPAEMAAAMEDMAEAGEAMIPAFAAMSAASDIIGTPAFAAAGPGHPFALDPARPGGEVATDYIPSQYYGTTFVWSTDADHYVPGDEEGAPEDGVRIIYYAVDPVTRDPVEPLEPLGYIDLRDLSTDEADRLSVVVVSTPADGEPVTLADYIVQSSFTVTQSVFTADLSAEGYISDGTAQVNFDLSNDLEITESVLILEQDYAVGLEGTDVAAAFSSTLTGDPDSDAGTVELTAMVTDGSEVVEFDLTTDAQTQSLDGVLRHQGEVVVLVGGTFSDPMFTDAEGDPLTQQQLAGLDELWDTLDVLFEITELLLIFN